MNYQHAGLNVGYLNEVGEKVYQKYDLCKFCWEEIEDVLLRISRMTTKELLKGNTGVINGDIQM